MAVDILFIISFYLIAALIIIGCIRLFFIDSKSSMAKKIIDNVLILLIVALLFFGGLRLWLTFWA